MTGRLDDQPVQLCVHDLLRALGAAPRRDLDDRVLIPVAGEERLLDQHRRLVDPEPHRAVLVEQVLDARAVRGVYANALGQLRGHATLPNNWRLSRRRYCRGWP